MDAGARRCLTPVSLSNALGSTAATTGDGQRTPTFPASPSLCPRRELPVYSMMMFRGWQAAWNGDTLVGYCVAESVWIGNQDNHVGSQLVVRKRPSRDRGEATRMLYSIWQFSDCYAWGLVDRESLCGAGVGNSHPEALQCRAHCRVGTRIFMDMIHHHIDYIPNRLASDSRGRLHPRVDSKFPIDHSQLSRMLRDAWSSRQWTLGDLDEGEEWFACTFQEQDPTAIEDERLSLLEGSDQIWIKAYEGMTLNANHVWHNYSSKEIDEIVAWTSLHEGERVLDLGCGDGRHAVEFANRGFEVAGIDISSRLIDAAQSKGSSARFYVGDCRSSDLLRNEQFDFGHLPLRRGGIVCRTRGRSSHFESTREIGCCWWQVPRNCDEHRIDSSEVVGYREANESDEFRFYAVELLEPSRAMQDSGSVLTPNASSTIRGRTFERNSLMKRIGGCPASW